MSFKLAALAAAVCLMIGCEEAPAPVPGEPPAEGDSRPGGATPATAEAPRTEPRRVEARRPADPERGADPAKSPCLAYWLDSKHYRVSSDISRQVCEDAAAILEKAWPIWCARFGLDDTYDAGPGLFSVRLYATQRLLHQGITNCTGFRVACLGFVDFDKFRLFALAHSEPYELRRILLHEGTHQFLYRLIGTKCAKALPRWYDEGCAHEAEKHLLDGGRLELFRHTGGWFSGQIARARYYFDRFGTTIDDFLTGSPIRGGDEAARACGWAIVHFLRTSEREAVWFRQWETALHCGDRKRCDEVVSELGNTDRMTWRMLAFLDSIAAEAESKPASRR